VIFTFQKFLIYNFLENMWLLLISRIPNSILVIPNKYAFGLFIQLMLIVEQLNEHQSRVTHY